MINPVVAIEGMEKLIRMLRCRIEQKFEIDRGEGGGKGKEDDVKLEHDVA